MRWRASGRKREGSKRSGSSQRPTMAMQHPGRDHDPRPCIDLMAGDLILADGLAGDRGRRRIKAQRLLDHGLGDDEAIERGRREISIALRRRRSPARAAPATRARRQRRKRLQLSVLAVVSCPAAMKVAILAFTSSGARPFSTVLGLEQQREKIARGLLAARQKLAAPRDDRLDRSIEDRERLLAAAAPEAGQKGRQVERVERMDPAERVEIARDRLRQVAGSLASPSEKIVRSSTSSVTCVISRAASIGLASGSARQRATSRCGDARHRRLEAFDQARREGGRERAPLRAPALAFGREEAVAEAGPQHARLQARPCGSSWRCRRAHA